jgi:hypothetical protein
VASRDGQVLVIGAILAREGRAPEDAPPAFDQVEPGGAHGNGDRVHARVFRQPVLDGSAGRTRAGIRDQRELTGRVGLRHRRTPGQIAGGSARGLGEPLPRLDGQRAIDPDLIMAAPLLQMGFDAVAIR